MAVKRFAPHSSGLSANAAATALWLLLIGHLTWSVRSSGQLASNPLNAGGLAQVVSDLLAGTLALLALHSSAHRPIPKTFIIYTGYIASVLLGIVTAVMPLLVVFRFCELIIYALVAYACFRSMRSGVEPLAHIIRFCWLMLASMLVALFYAPGEVLKRIDGVLPFQLAGVYPHVASNSVGTMGLLIFVWGLGRRPSRPLTAVSGATVVILSQYRTGYVALAVVFGVYLLARRGFGSRILLGFYGVALSVVTQTALFHEAWIRGNSGSVNTLDSRVLYWSKALEVAARSPIIGTGLTSGTRYEVLTDELGLPTTSTIHGSWVEAYVGTGLLGVGLLALAIGATYYASSRVARAHPLPLLLLSALGVRSITGTVFELPSFILLAVLIVVIYRVWDEPIQDTGAGTANLPFARRSQPRNRR